MEREASAERRARHSPECVSGWSRVMAKSAKKKKKASRSRTRDRGVRLSKSEQAQIDRELDRYMERWARHAIIVDGDVVRRLTEEEVQMAARKNRAPARRPRRKAVKKG